MKHEELVIINELFKKYKMKEESCIRDDAVVSVGMVKNGQTLKDIKMKLTELEEDIRLRDGLMTLALRALEEGNIDDAKKALEIM